MVPSQVWITNIQWVSTNNCILRIRVSGELYSFYIDSSIMSFRIFVGFHSLNLSFCSFSYELYYSCTLSLLLIFSMLKETCEEIKRSRLTRDFSALAAITPTTHIRKLMIAVLRIDMET
ncbi:hypothetical protein OIDMADRAFT_19792, partial [Oidiodendron maius Zn]